MQGVVSLGTFPQAREVRLPYIKLKVHSVKLYFSVALRMRQELFHLNSRTEIAHVSPPLVYNVNLCQENAVHRPVVGETRFSTNIRQLIEAITIPEDAITPVHP